LTGTKAMIRGTPSAGTAAASRVADVLLLFLHARSYGVTAIARELGLSKAVVHRILQSLESRSLISYDPEERLYRLGPAGAAIGARALQDLDLRDAAMPTLRQLAHATGETVTLSALIGGARVYVDQLVSHKEIKMSVELGQPFPLHAGASSRAILAFVHPELQREVLDEELPPLTPETITDRTVLQRSLDETARTGLACSRGERQHGAGSVAAPLFSAAGNVTGAFSVCGPIHRFDQEVVDQLAPLVLNAAQEISAALGYRGAIPPLPHPGRNTATAPTTNEGAA
jgi:IclR family transcriptional regulator, acetate operon repressor